MERGRLFSTLFLHEPLSRAHAHLQIIREIEQAKGAEFPAYTTPIVLVHGVLGAEHELHTTRRWLEKVGGATRVSVADIFNWPLFLPYPHPVSHGPIMHQVKRLIAQLEQLQHPAAVVGFSAGGSVATIAAALRPDLFKCVIGVDAPIVPITASDFKMPTLFAVNDITSRDVGQMLALPVSVPIISLRIPNGPLLERRSTERIGAVVEDLPSQTAHSAMIYDTYVLRRVMAHLPRS